MVKPLMGPRRHLSFANFRGKLNTLRLDRRTHFLFLGPDRQQFFILNYTKMIVGYRGALALMKVLLLPAGTPKKLVNEWIHQTERIIKKGAVTPKQALHLKAFIAEINRRTKMPKGTKIYPAGARTSKGVRASKGRRVKMMPFGTWYYKPV